MILPLFKTCTSSAFGAERFEPVSLSVFPWNTATLLAEFDIIFTPEFTFTQEDKYSNLLYGASISSKFTFLSSSNLPLRTFSILYFFEFEEGSNLTLFPSKELKSE